MLMLSDMLRVARGDRDPVELQGEKPLRFDPHGGVPAVVVWNVCRHCNMTCPHCYAAAGEKASSADLSTQEGLNLLEQLAETGVKVIIFSGGEPLLRKDLKQLIARATALGLSPQLSTNGSLLDTATVADLKLAGLKYVGVSIDGMPSFNDAYRGLERGFALAVEGLRRVKDAGLRTGMRVTVTKRNVEHVDALLNLAGEIGVNRFYVSHLVDSGRGHAMSSEDLGREDARTLLFRLFRQAENLLDSPGAPDLVTGSNDSDAVLLLQWLRESWGVEATARVEALLRQRGGNSAGERILCVDHRGRVHPDQFWQAATLGSIRTEALWKILRHPLRAQLAKRTELLTGRCGDCRFVDLCRGSHRERAIAREGGTWGPDPACVMHDEEIQLGAPCRVAQEGEA